MTNIMDDYEKDLEILMLVCHTFLRSISNLTIVCRQLTV